VLDAVAGFGPLQQYVDEPSDRGDLDYRSPARSSSPEAARPRTNTILTADEVHDLVERMLKSSGRRADLSRRS
jgi:pilus assembly protein CpaF